MAGFGAAIFWCRGGKVAGEDELSFGSASFDIVSDINESLFEIPTSKVGIVDTSVCYGFGHGCAVR